MTSCDGCRNEIPLPEGSANHNNPYCEAHLAKREYCGLFVSGILGDIKITGTEEAVKWAMDKLGSPYRRHGHLRKP